MMSLIHDMGELYGGDISAALCPDPQEKNGEESRAVHKAFSLLPEREAESLLALWREYNANATPEARLVKALDKAETIIQHNQGRNPEDFDYRFNLGYGKEYFEGNGFCANSARFWTKKPPPSSTVQIKRSHPPNDKGMGTIRSTCLFFALTGTPPRAFTCPPRFSEKGG